jgi:glycine cleavage system aminomethyltransferase T
LALALLEAPYVNVGREVWVEVYLNTELVWERRMCAARIVDKPFYAPERRRLTPPQDY